MALAIDATTPASFSTPSAISITSPSFSPPAGSLLVVLWGANNPGLSDTSIQSITNTGTATTWTRRARKAGGQTGSTGGTQGTNAGAEVWTAVAPGGAMTATITGLGTGTGFDKFAQIVVLTGADTANLANVQAASATSGLPSVTLTGVLAGSHVFASSSDWGQKGLGTPGTGQTIISEYNLAGQITIHTWRTTATTAAGSQTMNLTLPTAQQYNIVALEVRASSVAATPSPLPPRVMRNPTMRAAVI